MSIIEVMASVEVLAGIVPGHQASVQVRMPPSNVCPLPPRSGPLLDPCRRAPPLSEVKITSVRFSMPNARTVSSSSPTLESTSSTQSPSRPLGEPPMNRGAG